MGSIHIERKHNLGREEARRAVEDVAVQMRDKLDLTYNWNGDVLQFKRSGANGRIDVAENSVTVDVDLGFGLSMFKGPIEEQITSFLDERLR